MFFRYCQQSDGSESKTAPVGIFDTSSSVVCECLLYEISVIFTFQTEEMEEVEPYASYVQRVNSLYNSSAVMCA